ncbi:MAG: FtsQ-type POTRA domain-containing protein [Alphaproteobacteria bacterium]|nr:FtsQ-type POTRA domain-containing protein [Alphaproteobacteria bacterium]
MTADNKVYESVIWPYRLVGNLLLLGVIWLLTFGVITVRHNLVGKQIDSLLNNLYSKTATVGWGLNDITIEGRRKTSKEDVLNAIGLKRGDNILEIDLQDVCNQVQTLPWVKKAVVSRRYFPNVLHISIKEKNVKSIWQYQNEFYPIDEDGEIIATEFVPEKNLLLIVGEGAPDHFNSLLRVVEKDKDLFSRLKAANFISNRRWNLVFDDIENGVTVKMPEDDFEDAWKKLVKLDKTRGILKRKLTFVDLRLKNKVVVRLDTSDEHTD